MSAGTEKVLVNLDLSLNSLINALASPVSSDPSTTADGHIIYNSTSHEFKVRLNGAWVAFLHSTVTLDQIVAPAADVSANSHKITNLATPTASTDAATKAYADGLNQAVQWKPAVRAASLSNVTVASPGATIDGVTLAANDRVGLLGQTAPAENGPWVWNGAAVPLTRPVDFDASSEVVGARFEVIEGSTLASKEYQLTTAAPVTLGSTSLTFTERVNAGAIVGGAGLTLTGSTLDVNVDNSSIEINADTLRVKAAGITNAMLAASGFDAAKFTTGVLALAQGGLAVALTSSGGRTTGRAALVESGEVIVRGKAADITGDGSTTAFTFTHNFGTKDVLVKVKEATTDEFVGVQVVATSTNVVTINFAVAPINTKVYRVILGAVV